ncbi:MAG: Asp-tRNA(Asn)/Glu-tRNA(Gln) amidotransferase subunit GatA [Flavobacteriales bacterium]|nr:Asp-tRNA(Asn)/Glu-tRNA(Gln) amidotransferase subunit GatA [Flavobacteriales bacterium]MCX7768780.1 Asp-tRNA(Asn)/Glu-tRNA(Gln) amidotransferase subunit GatA [Flavobacteriales bacterium]MDW8409426.1 Asp-tRNA(Asn)/Glu-tRNA(Gln) amidotransferase subunit GatA [Flavobacteriales bacterium]
MHVQADWKRDRILGIPVQQRVQRFLEAIEAHRDLNCFAEVFEQSAMKRAAELDNALAAGRQPGRLTGMVIAIKDNILYKDHLCTASSKILQNFRAPYTATALQRLLDEGVVVIGRTSCDEFAMGSSNETSYYGPVRNPLAPECVPGGSSGGSAAAVAAGLCDAALGSDTGGSIRQPSAFCGIWGLKPGYGAVSRYGLIAYGSSFDQIGPMTANAEDAATLMEVMAGPDPRDATSDAEYHFGKMRNVPVSNLRIGYYPEILNSPDVGETVRNAYQRILDKAREAGAHLVSLSFPIREHLVPMYYVLSTAEASSNLARYDGVRYGYRAAGASSMEEMLVRTRTEGFGQEVRRRILLGTFVLSSGYYEAYYGKAQKARALLREMVDKQLSETDILLLPTTPDLPFRFGERSEDPVKMYLEDQFTVMANLSGHPALSFPVVSGHTFPVCGMQIIGPFRSEAFLLSVASQLSGF